MNQVKIAQFSDLHYSPGKLDEADRCFEAAVTAAICMGVDAAIITGDSTDHALDAHSPATRALAAQLKRLSEHCPVLMLQGTFSHEPPGFLRMISMVSTRYPISVADGISQWGLIPGAGFVRYSDEFQDRTKLVVSAMPTLNKANVAMLTEHVVDAASENARDVISSIIRGWAGFHVSQRERGIATMVISHGTVFNSISEHGVPMAGTDHELGVDTLFDAKADAVALGHIHKHQVWQNGTQKIAYPGSIGRFHHGEEGDKGWILWTLVTRGMGHESTGEEGAHIEFMPTPSRRNVDMVFEGPPDLKEIEARKHECEGAFVRIRYTIDEEHRQNVDRAAIRLILEKAAEVQIEGRTCIIQRQRAQGISTVSMSEKLKLWATVTGTPGADVLLDRLQLLETAAADEIAQQVVDRMMTAPVA